MIKNDKILEPQIKSIIINHLISKDFIKDGDSIINEFPVGDFTRRTDLVLAKQNCMIAFEIKSESDTLTRLSDQVDKYVEYFDKVVVVTAKKHTKKALETTPENIAVWELHGNSITIKRRGKKKEPKDKDKFIEMITAYELSKLANKLNIKPKTRKRKDLEHSLRKTSYKKIKKEAIDYIHARYEKTNSLLLDKTKNKKVTVEDLKLLRRNSNKTSKRHDISSFLDVIKNIENDPLYTAA